MSSNCHFGTCDCDSFDFVLILRFCETYFIIVSVVMTCVSYYGLFIV